jgi:hypothetical protein
MCFIVKILIKIKRHGYLIINMLLRQCPRHVRALGLGN